MTIGDRIRARREELHMSQEELATKLGYKSRSSVNKIELNGRNLTQSKIKAIADALRTTPSYIMGWDDAPVEPVNETTLTADESHLMDAYRTLNPTGKREAVKRVDELTYIPSYSIRWSETTLAAAHEADDATEETRKHDDDIMMDDSEWE